jgi:formate dehydrogenase major subunit
MELNRRDFIKGSTAVAAGIYFYGLLDSKTVRAQGLPSFTMTKMIGEKTTICPYCAVGCGQIVAAEGGKITNIEGDPDHPINSGALCSKGSALYQVTDNPRRLTKPLYRAPGSRDWQEKSWDWVLDQIARKIKNTRDDNWVENDADGYTVNRTEAIASLGGAAHDNEECYTMVKALRALGLVYIEHQARI